MLDDDRRKTMPVIGGRSHARSLRRTPPIHRAIFLTMRAARIPSIRGPERADQGARAELDLPDWQQNIEEIGEAIM
jgi:hypothetical protein